MSNPPSLSLRATVSTTFLPSSRLKAFGPLLVTLTVYFIPAHDKHNFQIHIYALFQKVFTGLTQRVNLGLSSSCGLAAIK